ncbi:hypothetical protein ACFSVK_08505 [Azorhizophilus paspali]|uniref:hypothetical protein n=1 Tax=Azorhizophilus paspali TaxID=69963 RepID=UPI003633EBA7
MHGICHAPHLFLDRRSAGLELAEALMPHAAERPLVLALPRGGVPVAFEAARMLHAELDILLVRRIGAPGHSGLALGAVIDGTHPQFVVNEEVIRQVRPRPAGSRRKYSASCKSWSVPGNCIAASRRYPWSTAA